MKTLSILHKLEFLEHEWLTTIVHEAYAEKNIRWNEMGMGMCAMKEEGEK